MNTPTPNALNGAVEPPPAAGWRNHLGVHPAANKVPAASAQEKRQLAGDLKRHGLKVPIVLVRVAGGPAQLLDGRHRLDLLEDIGTMVVNDAGRLLVEHTIVDVTDDAAAESISVSLNAHRRHLNRDDRRQLIQAEILAAPERSDRQIAETAKASPTTVGKVRAEMGSTVQSGQLPKRVGKDGKPKKKKQKQASPTKNEPASEPSESEKPSTDATKTPVVENPIAAAWAAASAAERLSFVQTRRQEIAWEIKRADELEREDERAAA